MIVKLGLLQAIDSIVNSVVLLNYITRGGPLGAAATFNVEPQFCFSSAVIAFS